MIRKATDGTWEPALGHWGVVIRRPHPALRPFVHDYTGYASREAPMRSRHFPSGRVGLIIGFESGLTVLGPATLADLSEHRTSFVAGLHETYSDSQWLGPSSGIQVDFTPPGAFLFFGLPMYTLSNRVVEFEDALGAEARRLVERLRETPRWDSRFRITESFVASRMLAANEPSAEVSWAWGEVQRADGAANIARIPGDLGWSKKRLISRFREQIGLTPKVAARVFRFSRVISGLEGAGDPDWAEVAAASGYYDQSHLIRDFREFAGVTPGEYLTMRRQRGDLAAD